MTIRPEDIARNLQRLRGERPSGQMFDEKGKPVASSDRPPDWRNTQARTPVKNILTGKK